jgi:hypothetical protein
VFVIQFRHVDGMRSAPLQREHATDFNSIPEPDIRYPIPARIPQAAHMLCSGTGKLLRDCVFDDFGGLTAHRALIESAPEGGRLHACGCGLQHGDVVAPFDPAAVGPVRRRADGVARNLIASRFGPSSF